MSASPSSPLSSARGSVLIVALILCAVIGLALASYLSLASTTLKISNRALYNNGAMNLAESGLEEAIYSLNQKIADPTYNWAADGWSTSGLNAHRKWENLALASQNATGLNRVMVYNYAGSGAPKIVARATVALGAGNEAPIEKWIEVTLGRTSKFANGLVAKNSIVFNGNNATVDSWNSDPDNDPSTPPVKYSPGVRNDNGSVGSISVSVNSVLVQNADIWGYVSTGGDDPTDNVGNNGSVLGEDSIYDAGTWVKNTVDPARISTEFSANFDDVSAPEKTANGTTISYEGIGAITSGKTLPLATSTPADDGYYYYTADQINFNNAKLIISDKVVLKLTNTSTGINIGGGSGEISIGSTGQLQVYTPGSIKIAGKGVSNGTDLNSNGSISDNEMGQPIQFQIYGTKTSGTQSIDIAGNGTLSGTIYAPYGTVKINGNGSVAGSVVANNITLVGNAAFHYDESLAAMSAGNPYRVTKWKELTKAAERSLYAADLDF